LSSIDKHIVVTPARNEADNLRRLGDALIDQTWRPEAWIVVDNGSTDATADVVRGLSREHEWIRLLSIEGTERAARGSASVRAFNAGIETLQIESGLLTNVDADVSFEPGYFAGLRDEFERRPSLGIASGLCYEKNNGVWEPVFVAAPNLRGASFTYRAECLAQLAPVEERVGWDGIDAVRANLRGWETGTIPTLSYFHHRATGARDASRFSGWALEGDVSYYMWYRPLYLVSRTAYRVVATRDLAATGLVWGYTRSAMRRDTRHAEPGFREVIRDRQALRNMTMRLMEVRGIRAPADTPDQTATESAGSSPDRA
jgi:GT2 family glycosyltransferase